MGAGVDAPSLAPAPLVMAPGEIAGGATFGCSAGLGLPDCTGGGAALVGGSGESGAGVGEVSIAGAPAAPDGRRSP